ncbi:MAG TPA: hypothetical protein VGL61_37150 [Kofleriaceae bacterium]|jgi:hypothetical protein
MKTPATETTALVSINSDSLDTVSGGWVGGGFGRAYVMAARAAAVASLAYPAYPVPPVAYYAPYYRHWRR